MVDWKRQEQDRFNMYIAAALTGLTARGTSEDKIGKLALRIGAQCYYDVNTSIGEHEDRDRKTYQTYLVDKAMPWEQS